MNKIKKMVLTVLLITITFTGFGLTQEENQVVKADESENIKSETKNESDTETLDVEDETNTDSTDNNSEKGGEVKPVGKSEVIEDGDKTIIRTKHINTTALIGLGVGVVLVLGGLIGFLATRKKDYTDDF